MALWGGPCAWGGTDGAQGSPGCFRGHMASVGGSSRGAAVPCPGRAPGTHHPPAPGHGDKGPCCRTRGWPGGCGGAQGRSPPCARSRTSCRALHMPVNFTPSALDGSLVIFGEPSHKFVPPHCSKLLSGDGRAPLPSTAGARASWPRLGHGTPGHAPAAAPVMGGGV